jgi:acyl-CoA dehydrogenase
VQFRSKVREFVEKEIAPNVDEWEDAQDYPKELHEKAYKAGVFGAIWPKEFGGTPPENFDIFHELIYWDELSRKTPGGALAACFLTIKIALPPILHTGPR